MGSGRTVPCNGVLENPAHNVPAKPAQCFQFCPTTVQDARNKSDLILPDKATHHAEPTVVCPSDTTPTAPAGLARTCADDGRAASGGTSSFEEPQQQESCPVEQGKAKLRGIIQRINQNKAPTSIHAHKYGWARKPAKVKRCSKALLAKRRVWVMAFYKRAVQNDKRANEWIAQRELTKDFPDEDDMRMEAASLKGAFGKSSLLRKAQEAVDKAAAQRVPADAAAPGAPPAEYAPSGNEAEDGHEAAIRLVIEEEEALLDDIVAGADDGQHGDCADIQEDLAEKLQEAGEWSILELLDPQPEVGDVEEV